MDYSDEEIPQEIQSENTVIPPVLKHLPPVLEHLPLAYGLPAVDAFRAVFTGGIYVSERPWYRRPNSVDRASVPNTYYRISVLEEIRITLLEQ
ncbi:hypothetical protein OROGR_007325 [Orobanche gracilis]